MNNRNPSFMDFIARALSSAIVPAASHRSPLFLGLEDCWSEDLTFTLIDAPLIVVPSPPLPPRLRLPSLFAPILPQPPLPPTASPFTKSASSPTFGLPWDLRLYLIPTVLFIWMPFATTSSVESLSRAMMCFSAGASTHGSSRSSHAPRVEHPFISMSKLRYMTCPGREHEEEVEEEEEGYDTGGKGYSTHVRRVGMV